MKNIIINIIIGLLIMIPIILIAFCFWKYIILLSVGIPFLVLSYVIGLLVKEIYLDNKK